MIKLITENFGELTFSLNDPLEEVMASVGAGIPKLSSEWYAKFDAQAVVGYNYFYVTTMKEHTKLMEDLHSYGKFIESAGPKYKSWLVHRANDIGNGMMMPELHDIHGFVTATELEYFKKLLEASTDAPSV